jgi:hypothetical protein
MAHYLTLSANHIHDGYVAMHVASSMVKGLHKALSALHDVIVAFVESRDVVHNTAVEFVVNEKVEFN